MRRTTQRIYPLSVSLGSAGHSPDGTVQQWPALRQRLRHPRPQDLRYPLALAGVGGAAALYRHSTLNAHTGGLLAFLLLVGMIGLLIRVGQHPLFVLALVALAAAIYPDRAAVALPLLLALFFVAQRADRRLTAVAVLATLVVLVALLASGGSLAHENLRPLVPWSIALGLATAAGLYFGARRDYVGSLHDRAEQLERERALLAEQAVADERVRIARELHDAVAHGVSLMVVQAQSLSALDEQERDRTAARIATVGREALAEMHRMLDVLRPQEDGVPALAPAPGVGELPALIDGARNAGVDVSLAIVGTPRVLPTGVDLSAYRIVQEALTNVIKHAQARHASVRVAYDAGALELSVIDDGAGDTSDGAGGHGLLGMRERVALFGGTLDTGERSDGPGYRVRAVLPL